MPTINAEDSIITHVDIAFRASFRKGKSAPRWDGDIWQYNAGIAFWAYKRLA